MTSKPVQGTYSDAKFIKSRKVLQVIIEIPVEHGDAFFEKFGVPNSHENERWIELSDLGHHASLEGDEEGDKAVQQAGILCKDPEFGRFLAYYLNVVSDENNCDKVADLLRDITGVKSRTEYRHDKDRRRAFHNIVSQFHHNKRTGG